jgi:hypothetical protein
VASDAPDDYVALRELKDKPDFRAKFSLTDEMVRTPPCVKRIVISSTMGSTWHLPNEDTLRMELSVCFDVS